MNLNVFKCPFKGKFGSNLRHLYKTGYVKCSFLVYFLGIFFGNDCRLVKGSTVHYNTVK